VPGVVRGLNVVGLRRAGFAAEDLRALKQAYRTLFRGGRSLEATMAELGASTHPLVGELVSFIGASKRGFHRNHDD
jgi:UDP-N-acetylglucosamine acyltransferase